MTKRVAISVGGPAKVAKMPPASLEQDVLSLLERVKSVTVTTATDCVNAVELVRAIRARRDAWQNHELPVVKQTQAAYNEARRRYNQLAKPLEEAEKRLKEAVGRFKLTARKIAESTALATNRVSLDAQTQALARHTESVETAAAAALAARAEEIAEAEEAGDLQKADRLRAMPVHVEWASPSGEAAVVFGPGELAAAVDAGDDVSVGEQYKFEIVDPDLVPDEFYSIDEKKIRGVVAVMKGQARIPGVRVFVVPRVSLR